MSRPSKKKKVSFIPNVIIFKPEGDVEKDDKNTISLNIEELEAIRLVDLYELDQNESAEKMETSRGTLQRMLVSGRKKVADALINGKKIVIEGGNYSISECVYKCTACGNRFTRLEGKTDSKNNLICPLCGSKEYFCEKTKKFCLHKCNQHKEDAK